MKKLSDFDEYLKYRTLDDGSCDDCFDEYCESLKQSKLNEYNTFGDTSIKEIAEELANYFDCDGMVDIKQGVDTYDITIPIGHIEAEDKEFILETVGLFKKRVKWIKSENGDTVVTVKTKANLSESKKPDDVDDADWEEYLMETEGDDENSPYYVGTRYGDCDGYDDCFDEYCESVIKDSKRLQETRYGCWGVLWNGKLIDSKDGYETEDEAKKAKIGFQKKYPNAEFKVASPDEVNAKYKAKETCKDNFKV